MRPSSPSHGPRVQPDDGIAIAISDDDQAIAVAIGWGVTILDSSALEAKSELRPGTAHLKRDIVTAFLGCRGIAFDPDGRLVVAAGPAPRARVCDVTRESIV